MFGVLTNNMPVTRILGDTTIDNESSWLTKRTIKVVTRYWFCKIPILSWKLVLEEKILVILDERGAGDIFTLTIKRTMPSKCFFTFM